MKAHALFVTLASGLLLSASGLSAHPAMAKSIRRPPSPIIAPGDVTAATNFAMLTAKPSTHRAHARGNKLDQGSLTGSSIAAIAGGALVIDGETGTLSLLDSEAKQVDAQVIGTAAGLLCVDARGKRVFVADRNGDRIAVIPYSDSLGRASYIQTKAEPYGLALTPDGKTLLVSSIAGRSLQAFDTGDASERWSLDIGPEPRAVAISADGREAMVSFLGTAAIARLTLSAEGTEPRLRFQALHTEISVSDPDNNAIDSRQRVPERYARNAFAATFVGDTAVVAYQQSTPLAAITGRQESQSVYGGSAQGNPPILHRLAFLPRSWNAPGRAHVRVQMPRALAYDEARDALYIADMANDQVYGLRNTSSASIQNHVNWSIQHDTHSCGPDGIAIADNGDLFVHCSFDKRVARIHPEGQDPGTLAWSPALSKSKLSEAAQRGRALFHKGNDGRLSSAGSMSCGNCHPEARNDGLSWRIGGTDLQTPLLAGRLVGTHPFKWDGQDKDLHTSLMHTVVRLGGSGIAPSDASDLQAYLESLPAVRTMKSSSQSTLASASARGKELFASKELGCASCHAGVNYSDGKSYEFSDDLPKVNTPSLIGLAASAPYYHDGSAATLRDLLLENGSVHGMGKLSQLKAHDVDALVAYLETL